VNPQYILIAAVIIVMGWFAIGVLYNLRRGDALLKWMQAGLPSLGQKTTFRWLGTSVAELVITQAKKPFRRLEILLVLKPRDVFWMTLLALYQGRSDIVIYRGQLAAAPPTDLELVDPGSWSGREAFRQFSDRRWESRDYQGMRLLAPAGLLDLAAQTLDRLAVPMQKFSGDYVRLGLRRQTSPSHFEVHVPFPAYRTQDARGYFEALRGLARAISERDE
jgi:hypothetical protein